MNRSRFPLSVYRDPRIMELLALTDHRTLGVWARDCAERVMPYFEQEYPQDDRPRNALLALQTWVETGIFRMEVIRRSSLASHAAARDAGEDSAARSAARAAGQAVATAHVPAHSAGAAMYALQAIHRTTDPAEAEAAVAREREWQYRRLLTLRHGPG
jgi:Imm-5 like putative immunity protein